MNVAALIKSREPQWQELETYLTLLGSSFGKRKLTAEQVARFAALHRAACADLALCRSYRMPPGVIKYLNDLVGRSHNRLYRDQTVTLQSWLRMIFFEAPQRIFSDPAFWTAMCVFWGPFLFCAVWAANSPELAQKIVGQEMLDAFESQFEAGFNGMDFNHRLIAVGFYIRNNAGIGLTCFALGILVMIPGLMVTLFNAIFLGTLFGYMYGSAHSANFYEFVMAHGPFELTAIVLASGAGLRLGFSLIHTRGFTRHDSLRLAARETVPIITVATILFGMAAFIEAFISPSPMGFAEYIGLTPMLIKSAVAEICTLLLVLYIVFLGGMQTLEKRRTAKKRMPE